MGFNFERTMGEVNKERENISPELIKNAESALRDFVVVKPEERALFLTDSKTNPETLKILKQAIDKIGSQWQEILIDDNTQREDINNLLKEVEVVINVIGEGHEASGEVYDDIEEYGNRMVALYEAEPDIFSENGALSENFQELQERLNKMEAVLKEAVGFHITSRYGTDLKVGLPSFHSRRWAKENGLIDQPGQWDNLPSGEVYTTPQENNVNGILVLPALETDISSEQGVDELVHLTIRDGVITNIAGGESAEKMRKYLEEKAGKQIKEGDNVWNVFRISEIGFGANSKARYIVKEEDPGAPATPTVEAEKRFGTMHLAFGDSKHGEEGVEGLEEAVSHLDFVLPRTALTVEMFRNEKDFRKGKNGRKIFNNGGVNF